MCVCVCVGGGGGGPCCSLAILRKAMSIEQVTYQACLMKRFTA